MFIDSCQSINIVCFVQNKYFIDIECLIEKNVLDNLCFDHNYIVYIVKICFCIISLL